MNGGKRIWAVIEKEILHIMRDKVVLMICFLAPVFLTLLFGYVYIEHKVTKVPVVVLDQDQTDISRTIITAFNDSERLRITKYVSTYDEMQKEIEGQKAFMGVVIPNKLKHDIKSGQSTEVAIILNGSNMLLMNTVANAASQIIQTISAGINIKIMEGYGISSKKAMKAVTSVNFRTRVWYNPTTSYVVFMLLGLVGTTLQQLALLAMALSISKERERGTWRNIMYSRLRSYEVVIGKFLVYFVIFSVNAVIMYSLAIKIFGIPMRGSLPLVIITSMIFVFVVLMIGLLISSIIKSQVQAIEISMVLAVPSFLISGYTWPIFSMPEPLQIVSKLFPLTHFLEAMRSLMYMGQGFEMVKSQIMFLLVLVIVFLPLSIIFVAKRMRRG